MKRQTNPKLQLKKEIVYRFRNSFSSNYGTGAKNPTGGKLLNIATVDSGVK